MEIRLSLNELETCEADDIAQAIEYAQNQVELYSYTEAEFIIGDLTITVGG